MKKLLFLLCLSAGTTTLHAQTPDTSFGMYGLATTSFYGSNEAFNSLALQPDGKIIAAGFAKNTAGKQESVLARFDTSGGPDLSFNSTGKVMIPATVDEGIRKVVLQANGKILTAGTRQLSATDWSLVLMRFLPNGAPDNNFGTAGVVTLSMSGKRIRATNLAVQSDGKIVVAGSQLYDKFVIARFDSTGLPDAGFGNNGVVMSCYDAAETISSEGGGLGIQPDGKILICGAAWTSVPQVGVARYNANGTIDNSFGTNGRLMLTSPNGIVAPEMWGGEELVILPGGSIVMSVVLSTPSTAHQPCLVRITASGVVDNSFGLAGYARGSYSAFYEVAPSLLVQPNGKLLAAGYVQGSSTGDSLVVLQFEANGMPTAGFGTNGRLSYKLITTGQHGTGLALQSNGKILLSGFSGAAGSAQNMLMRLKFPTPVVNSLPTAPALSAVAGPNPASEFTILRFHLSRPGQVWLSLVDVTGKTVRRWPATELLSTGVHTLKLDLQQIPTGSYQLVVQTSTSREALALLVR